MLTTANHALITFYAALNWAKCYSNDQRFITRLAKNYFEENVSCLLLPKALELYGNTQHTHFIRTPQTKGAFGVKICSSPKDLSNIKFIFDEYGQQYDEKCIITGNICQDVFWFKNPAWKNTFYSTHLGQDNAFNIWLKFLIVDCSQSSNNQYIYRLTDKTVDLKTIKEDIKTINEIIFQRISEKMYKKFGILPDEKWFEEHVYDILIKNYSQDMAEYTWSDIELPSEEIKVLPDFVSEEQLKYCIGKIENDTWML